MTIVQIPLDADSARIYRKASAENKKKMQILLSLWLREFEKPSKSLKELMDEIGDNAEKRGLIPKKLESILHDE